MRPSMRPLLFLLALLLLLIGEAAPRVCRILEPDYRDVDLATLGGFNLDERGGTIEDVPARIRAMDGTNVRISTNVVDPSDIPVKGIWLGHFAWRDPDPAAVQRFVFARARGDARFYFPECYAVTVQGMLHVQVERSTDGIINRLYSIDVDRIELAGARPSWWPLTLAGALVIVCWGVLVARDVRRWLNRLRVGLCRQCGYDLRASPDRCPECGAIPTAKPPRPGGTGG